MKKFISYLAIGCMLACGSLLAQSRLPLGRIASPAYFDGSAGCGQAGAASYILATFNGTSNLLEIGFGQDEINWCYDLIQTGIPGRDPSLFKYANDGLYYMATTVTGGTGNFNYWNLFSSSDGKSWGAPTPVSVTGGGLSVQNTWAPSWFVDIDGSIHVFVSIGLTTGGFQIYEMHPLTSDLKGAWSNPLLVTIAGETDTIDPCVVCKATGDIPCTSGTSGNTYYLWYTATHLDGWAQYASSLILLGTYTDQGTGDWDSLDCHAIAAQCEGQQVIYNAGANSWRRFEDLAVGSAIGQTYYTDSADWTSWTPLKPIATAPYQAKQGAVYPYP